MAESVMVVKETEGKEEIQQILEEEAFMILHSGEIPEIAYHSSLHYLFEDDDGPGLESGSVDLHPLKEAVIKRYRKILLRDMNPVNRDKRIYRGIARSIANWHRLKRFALEEGFDLEEIRQEAREQLLAFLKIEHTEVSKGLRSPCINCSFEELKDFAKELGLALDQLPDGIERLCMTP